ncbi:hypothetical protein OAM80_00450 [Gammaproteobacteria bacterium]|jgi:hypothetical protein|nr:hypothetical protein [Gammaproteobacteria bacterium]MDC0392237.1 hypothetical protein [Gammaproteobacteria bacterium]MDC3376236.1 hypothetical protein [Gammaproteobacteria bacterium]|tara:strand:- start:3029 stop:3430 length:402 start_codon:yes stop_codon:yes gene_type:complete
MPNFKLLKKIFLSILILPAGLLIFSLFLSFLNKPVIDKIENLNFNELKNESILIKEKDYLIEENNQVEFNYILIGIRSGNQDSSVIVKKGNKEFLVVLGDILEGSFELVEVNQNDALFRKGQKMYRIERQKDK